jgi:hypothetical protein
MIYYFLSSLISDSLLTIQFSTTLNVLNHSSDV